MTDTENVMLDKILTMLRDKKTNNQVFERSMTVLAIRLTAERLGLKADVAKALYDILLDDKLVEKVDGGYRITDRGVLFNEFEGFVKKHETERLLQKDLKDRMHRAEKRDILIAQWTKRGSLFALLAALAATGLLIWEMRHFLARLFDYCGCGL